MLKILLSNDDGVEALGLKQLYCVLRSMGTCNGRKIDVRVSAPATNQSAMSHKLTIGGGLQVKRRVCKKAEGDEENPSYEEDAWVLGVTGTPVDSVRAGLQVLEQEKWSPDVIMSGVNHGNNLGMCSLY